MRPKPDPSGALTFSAALVGPLAIIAPLALAIVLPVTALVAAATSWRTGRPVTPPLVPSAICTGVLAWSGTSAAWSADPGLVWSIWLQIAAIAASALTLLGVACTLDDDARVRIGTALVYGVTTGLGLLAVEWMSGIVFDQSVGAWAFEKLGHPFKPHIFNRGCAVLALLLWPAAYVLYARKGFVGAAALIATASVMIAQFESLAAVAGIVTGIIVGFVSVRIAKPCIVALGLAFVLAGGMAAAPVLPRLVAPADIATMWNIPGSSYHRLLIWSYSAQIIGERPVTGQGLNASRAIPKQVADDPRAGEIPLHPHNAFLQWWLELGGIGVALILGLLLIGLRGAARLAPSQLSFARPAQAAALALAASAIVMGGTAYGIWQTWWMATLWLAVILMATVAGSSVISSPDNIRRLSFLRT